GTVVGRARVPNHAATGWPAVVVVPFRGGRLDRFIPRAAVPNGVQGVAGGGDPGMALLAGRLRAQLLRREPKGGKARGSIVNPPFTRMLVHPHHMETITAQG